MNNLYDDDYFDLKDYEYNYDDDCNNVLELKTISKNDFNKLIKYIENAIKKAKENNSI